MEIAWNDVLSYSWIFHKYLQSKNLNSGDFYVLSMAHLNHVVQSTRYRTKVSSHFRDKLNMLINLNTYVRPRAQADVQARRALGPPLGDGGSQVCFHGGGTIGDRFLPMEVHHCSSMVSKNCTT